MNEKRLKAIVRVTMDVEASSIWGSGTTWDQIAKQAEDDVRGLLTNDNQLTLKDIPKSIKNLRFVQVVVFEEGKQ